MKQKYFNFRGAGTIVFVNDPCTGAWLWQRMIPIFDSLGYDAVAVNPADPEGRARLDAALAGENVAAVVAQGAGGRFLTNLDKCRAFLIAPSDEALSPERWPEGRAKAEGCAYEDWRIIERRLNRSGEARLPAWSDAIGESCLCVCCAGDKVVSAEEQQLFAARHGIESVCELNADHFPQFSRTYELSYLIHSALMDRSAR